MKSRIKPLFVCSLVSVVLAACGGGGGSNEPLAVNPSAESQQTEAPNQAVVPEQAVVPAQSAVPQEPQDPMVAPLPIANQTGWTISGIETRDPLDLLKSIVCVQRARMETVATPASSEDCTTAFPDLVSNGSLRFAELPVPVGTAMQEREGCVYLPDVEQALVCSWQFSRPDSSVPSGVVNYWASVPFSASFSPGIEGCEAGKDHWFPMMAGRGADASSGPTVKIPAFPQGCVGWQEVTEFVENAGVITLNDDRQPD